MARVVDKALEKDMKEHPEKYFTGPEGHVRDRIIVHESAKIPKEGLFVGLNGYAFLIKPGVEVDLPRPVRLMLDTCIEKETIQDEEGKNYDKNITRATYTIVKAGVNMPPPGVKAASNPDEAIDWKSDQP